MSQLIGMLLFVGVPTAVCAAAGVWHGRRPTATRFKIVLGAFALSAITCWSVFAGGGGDMPLPGVFPSWFASPLYLLAGPKTYINPPWWISPWLPFAAYLIGARFAVIPPRN